RAAQREQRALVDLRQVALEVGERLVPVLLEREGDVRGVHAAFEAALRELLVEHVGDREAVEDERLRMQGTGFGARGDVGDDGHGWSGVQALTASGAAAGAEANRRMWNGSIGVDVAPVAISSAITSPTPGPSWKPCPQKPNA